jgi:twitching motility protein PilT
VVEVLRGDSVTAKYILEDKITDLADYIATGENKMQTFDIHAVELFRQDILTQEEALRVATHAEAVELKMRVGTHVRRSSVSGTKE